MEYCFRISWLNFIFIYWIWIVICCEPIALCVFEALSPIAHTMFVSCGLTIQFENDMHGNRQSPYIGFQYNALVRYLQRVIQHLHLSHPSYLWMVLYCSWNGNNFQCKTIKMCVHCLLALTLPLDIIQLTMNIILQLTKSIIWRGSERKKECEREDVERERGRSKTVKKQVARLVKLLDSQNFQHIFHFVLFPRTVPCVFTSFLLLYRGEILVVLPGVTFYWNCNK